jgi:hypothetical protein
MHCLEGSLWVQLSVFEWINHLQLDPSRIHRLSSTTYLEHQVVLHGSDHYHSGVCMWESTKYCATCGHQALTLALS